MVAWRGQRPHVSDTVFDHKVLPLEAAVLHTTENRMKAALSKFCYEHYFHDQSVWKHILNDADAKRWLLGKARMVLPTAAFCQLQSYIEDQSQRQTIGDLQDCANSSNTIFRHPRTPPVANQFPMSQAFLSQPVLSNLFNCPVVSPPPMHPSYPDVAQSSVTLPLPMIQPLPSLHMSLLNQ